MKESLLIEYFENIRNKKMNYYERELKIQPMEGKAISIIGPRRAGKTYFLMHEFLKHPEFSLYMDLESIEFSGLKAEDILKVIALYEARYKGKVKNVLVDEVQNLHEWQSLVRTLLNRGYVVFISGSSSKLLSKEIATSLRGRTLSYLLLPFSFREFISVKGMKPKEPYSEHEVQTMKIYLNEYLEYGSFPEVVMSENKEKILKEYFDTIFYKDFVERHSVKSMETARVIFEYLFQNFSKEISIEKIKNYIMHRIGVETKRTIYSYADKIEDTFAVFFVDKYSESVYKRRNWPKKVYVCDVGIPSILSFSQDTGKKMENTVFLELLRKTNSNPFLQYFYFKDYQQREVDFVIKERNRVKELIQVTYASGKDEIERRELRALKKASELLNCKNLKVITWDYEDVSEGIEFIPLWKWLLNPLHQSWR